MTEPSPTVDDTEIFRQLETYPWDKDKEFQVSLAILFPIQFIQYQPRQPVQQKQIRLIHSWRYQYILSFSQSTSSLHRSVPQKSTHLLTLHTGRTPRNPRPRPLPLPTLRPNPPRPMLLPLPQNRPPHLLRRLQNLPIQQKVTPTPIPIPTPRNRLISNNVHPLHHPHLFKRHRRALPPNLPPNRLAHPIRRANSRNN